MPDFVVVILAALASALATAAGAGWGLARQIAALRATVDASFAGLEVRLSERAAEVSRASGVLEERVDRLEEMHFNPPRH